MKGKVLVGLALTLVLSVCPFVAEVSAAATPGAHSCCCPSSRPARPSKSSLPAKGDCCLRAPARGTLSLAVPDLRSTPGVLVEARPIVSPRHESPAVLAALSPPGEGLLVRGASPRSPPLPA